ncbi:MAG: aldehyde dehydrogenase family protein [Amphiplicatus sp.]
MKLHVASARTALPRETISRMFEDLGAPLDGLIGGSVENRSPIDGGMLCTLKATGLGDFEAVVERASAAFAKWRLVPPPARGELVRRFCASVREHRGLLAGLITLECGKTNEEAAGEIQEVIDICEFAVGLSRQLYGLAIATERPGHRMAETWHPLGVFGQITAFNFPAAVWSWGAMIALVCGDSVIWKPSEKAPLTALALNGLLEKAASTYSHAPAHLSQVVIGDKEIGRAMARDERIAVLSATGSTTMGREVAVAVAARLGRSILELGGNNAAIVTPHADIDLAVRGIVFAAVGTAGQRCTTMRRLIAHRSIADALIERLKAAYAQLRVDDPSKPGAHIGPLIDAQAYQQMQKALATARNEGGDVWGGERVLEEEYPEAFYVRPAIVRMPAQTGIVKAETFAPILYALEYDTLEEAIALQNGVTQGLSSAIFTTDMREAETFLSASGSDCGIANVNIGTSGAEIGGAFGGEKATGGGRAAGSDTWKNFMRRATNTINYSTELPLSQGIEFGS